MQKSALAFLFLLSGASLADDTTCTALTTAITMDCAGSCPDAVVSDCPSSKEANFFPSMAYQMELDVSPCISIFPKGCPDQRATCECANGAATCGERKKQCDIILRGNLWVPRPAKKHGYPVVIYNHGSVGCAEGETTCAHAPGEACSIVSYFVSKGYAVMTPVRRGYSPSTGTYFSEWSDDGTASLEDEARDVTAAIHFLQTPNNFGIDPNKIAVMGHSLGGIVTLFTNRKDVGQRTSISIAGASESWCGSSTLRDALFTAVDEAKTPIYFFEPRNDVDTNPTIQLSHEAGIQQERYAASIFGEATDSSGIPILCGKKAHVCFVNDENQVKRWGPSVVTWLRRFNVK